MRVTTWPGMRFGWLLVVLAASTASAQLPGRLVVRGHGTDLGETPLSVELGKKAHPGLYLLKRLGDGRQLAAEIYELDGRTYLGAVLDRVKGDGADEHAMRIRSTRDDDALGPGIRLEPEGPHLKVLLGDKPFTRFVTGVGAKPFLYPVVGPTGDPITRAYPMETVEGEDRDHPHQRSFWFTHGKVNAIDFWSEQKGHGTIRERDRRAYSSDGGPMAVVRTRNDWVGPDGKKVCEDERLFRFYATKEARVLDFDITIKATDGPVTFGDTKEGMFGIRVASTMDVKRKQGGKITNAEGISDGEAWGKASPWVDYTGPVNGQTVGVAILNHPSSFRYPTTWHVRDYGLFAANPFGWRDFGLKESGDHTIPAGQSITFRYRVLLHKGDTDSANLPAAFKAYAEPPRVEIHTD